MLRPDSELLSCSSYICIFVCVYLLQYQQLQMNYILIDIELWNATTVLHQFAFIWLNCSTANIKLIIKVLTFLYT